MLMIPNILVDHSCGAENSLPSPGSRQCDTKQPLLGRAMLIGRPCLVFECLREAMNLRGIETHACRFEKPFSLSVSEYGYDILVIFVMRGESRDRQMIAELRSHVPHAPAVALVEDPNAEAASFCGRGFSTVILGLPSVSFAVGVVQLLLLGSRHLRECHRSDRDLQSHSAHQENFDREPDAGMPDICFTPRELDLLDLLRRGMQNKLIAYELGISQSTVKAHLRSIMMKLKAKNRTEVACMLEAERTREVIHG
jgi:DNA-binding NarL/FixJ family response regulator